MKTKHLAFVALGVVVYVAGCGGGSGGSGGAGGTNIPTAAVQITTSNAPAVAKGAMTPSQNMVTTGSGQAGIVGVVAQASGHSRSVLDISLAELNRARSFQFSPVVAGAIQGVTLNCTGGGTVTGSIQDRDSSNSFTVDDVLTMSFSNCVEPATGTGNSSTLNGNATFSIASASGPLVLGAATGTSGSPFTAAFKLTFSSFTSKDNVSKLTDSINGDINFSTSDDGTNTTGSMSGASVRIDSSVDGAFLVTNYSISFMEANTPTISTPYSFSVNMTVASVVANGSVAITTTTPFTGVGTGDPTAGVLVIAGAKNGANNTTLTLTALPNGTTVRMVVDDGSGIGPQPLPDSTWAAI